MELRATYRLQLGPELGFAKAQELLPYLRDLGISHLYLSPIMQARSGSTHGYDVVDPTRISEPLGGEDAFRELCAACREHGLGVVLDIVPNHMAATDENPLWRDPLMRAKFFDLDWRTGAHRRFFDVGELAGVRMEDPEVWELRHAKLLELVGDGLVDGVRVDHPDGLANPRRYLERLREAGIERVWVEKILEPGERLRDDWPVAGTTGYEFLNDVTALFVDPAGEEPLTRLYEELTGEHRPFEAVAGEAKLEQARTTFADEAEQLAAKLPFEVDLAAALAALHVYRTYVDPEAGLVAPEDRAAIEAARLPAELARILLLEERGNDAFVVRFQQTTPPVHAKGVEDTAFYRWHRFVALNEVGGDPARFSLSVEEFHAANAARPPGGLLAATTHDTKRSGDVRARLACIAAAPEEWEALVRPRIAGWRDPNEAYFILQTVVGAWPLTPDRLEQYLEKALREAKVNTNWLDQDHDWEAGAKAFARLVARGRRRRRLRRAPRRGGRARRARPDAAQAHITGRAGRLPGRRAPVSRARRPRQPPARRLGRAAAAACRRGAAEARPDQANARAAGAADRRVRGVVRPGRGGPGRRCVHPRRRGARRRCGSRRPLGFPRSAGRVARRPPDGDARPRPARLGRNGHLAAQAAGTVRSSRMSPEAEALAASRNTEAASSPRWLIPVSKACCAVPSGRVSRRGWRRWRPRSRRPNSHAATGSTGWRSRSCRRPGRGS